jgi:acetoin utilization deacetylase AcuC-like enzyme
VSIHGDPDVHFPFFGGYADERGARDGEGAHRNLPLPSGAGWDRYVEALDAALAWVDRSGADVLVVSLGVDTDATDGVLSLTGDDYARLGTAIAGLRRPTAFIQEGGYGTGVLERNVSAVLRAFADA